MNGPSRSQLARMIADDCVLWLKTEWRFHFALGVLAVLVSLWLSIRESDATLFARAGALMTITGVVMTYRSFFRGREDAYLRGTGRADRRAFSRWHPLTSREEAKAEDQKAFKWALISFVIGTVIWAYGDLMLPTQKPNKAPEPTTRSVTPRAFVPNSDCKNRTDQPTPARVAPERVVAHL